MEKGMIAKRTYWKRDREIRKRNECNTQKHYVKKEGNLVNI
jgi:hypothetical protein